MTKIKVEILVRSHDSDDGKGYNKGDIITVMPANTNWGRGDLTGNFMFSAEIDVPSDCINKKYESNFKCKPCYHVGIRWEKDPPIVGTKGRLKTSCALRKLLAANVDYVLEFDIHGYPDIKHTLISKSNQKIDYSSLLDDQIKEKIENEKPHSKADFINEVEQYNRLSFARQDANIIPLTVIMDKISG